MIMSWKNDEDDDSTVQFVATVVVDLKHFWVKSVFSVPIPPCKQRHEVSNWQRPAVTAPPPVGRFKIDTFNMFNQQNAGFLANSISNTMPPPVARPLPTFTAPPPVQFTQPPPVQFTQPPLTRVPIVTFRPNPFV
jgi:hypothetical protein